jgi:peptidoglycan/LPS O-acetylase OafA/YrhL
MGNASIRGTVDIWAALRGGFESLSALPAGIFTGTHLWFLYYLALITALTLLGRGLLAARRSWKVTMLRRGDRIVAWLADVPDVPGVPWILALPTAGALWFMSGWGMDTPDRSLSPHFPVLTIYGGFFIFGWVLGRQRELITRFARVTPLRCVQAAIGIAVILFLAGIERNPAHPHHFAAHLGYALGYASTMWSLVFLTIGVFQKICRRPNAAVRYVADSSYWMYLIHLPVAIWLQVAVAEVELHWSLKLTLVSAVTIAISLITYDLFVRSTFVGWVMNGRRQERVILPSVFGRLLGRS